MITIKRYLPILIISLLALSACNKEIDTKKAISVTFGGYNISDSTFEISLDTVVYKQNLMRPNRQIDFSKVYPYFSTKSEVVVHIKNRDTGKMLFEKTLPLNTTELEFFFPLVHINGRLVDVPEPAADPTTNKLGFYVHYTESDDPIDIMMKNMNTGEIAYLARNVKPGTWAFADYLPAAGFLDKNDIGNSILYFTKAGTVDQWAFYDDEYISQAYAFGTFIPHSLYNLNKVQSYFIIPSISYYQTEIAQLFRRPKNY